MCAVCAVCAECAGWVGVLGVGLLPPARQALGTPKASERLAGDFYNNVLRVHCYAHVRICEPRELDRIG